MVVADDGQKGHRRSQGSADSLADDRMLAHELPLVLVQWAGLGQDRFGDADLAHVVQERTVGDDLELHHGQTRPRSQSCRHVRQSLAVALGHGVLGFHGVCQCSHRRVGLLHSHQGLSKAEGAADSRQ